MNDTTANHSPHHFPAEDRPESLRIETLQTELKRLQEHFDAELERQKIDALAEFAAGAGHEINNPLAIIAGHAQLLLQEIEHPEQRRQLAVIAAQARRAYEMIADVRFFARPPKPEPSCFDIIADLRQLVDEHRPLMSERQILLNFKTEMDKPLFVRTDRTLLHVATSFLCNNAREALQNGKTQNGGGLVCLTLNRIGARGIEIVIEDNGPGIDASMRPLIFCPYFSGRQAGRGLGFGLPKAWRILQQLGGEIHCTASNHSAPDSGSGTRFVLTLPDVIEV